MQIQETFEKNALRITYFKEKCEQHAQALLEKEKHPTTPIKTTDDLLAAAILTTHLQTPQKTLPPLIAPSEYSINSQSKTLSAFLCAPSEKTIHYALAYIEGQPQDELSQYTLQNYSHLYTKQTTLKIPLINHNPLIKTITRNTKPLIPTLFNNEKNTAALLDENNINYEKNKTYQELNLEEKKKLNGALIRQCIENQNTQTATKELTGTTYQTTNTNSLDELTYANAATYLDKQEQYLKAALDSNINKQVKTTTENYLNLKKVSAKTALRITSDYGKFYFYNALNLPEWLARQTAKSLQTLEKYQTKPLVTLVNTAPKQTLEVSISENYRLVVIENEDLSQTLKELNNEF